MDEPGRGMEGDGSRRRNRLQSSLRPPPPPVPSETASVDHANRPNGDTAIRAVSDLDALPVLIPVPRAAELLGVSRASAYRYALSGVLPTTRLGGRVFIHRDRLRALLEAA
jgi:excisionase family DNA binding protein